MAFFFDLTKLSKILEVQCLNYDDSLTSGFFFAYNFWPSIIGAVGIGIFVAHKEVFYTLLMTGFTINAAINWGIREGIGQDGPESNCFTGNQMPAYAADGITFIATTFMIGSGCVYHVPLRWFTLAMIWVGGPVALYARVWLRTNTPAQMFAGAGFGMTEALLFLFILKHVLTYDRIERWFIRSSSWIIGSNYQDTLIRPQVPVLCVNTPISELLLKVNTSNGVQKARTAENFDDRLKQLAGDESLSLAETVTQVKYIFFE